MKKIILIFVFTIISNIIYAQSNEENIIPTWVETTLNKQYENISIDDWEKIENNYFVHFKYNQHQTEVCVGPNQNIVFSQTELNENELPSLVIEAFKGNHSSEIINKIKLKLDYKGYKTYIINTISNKDLIFDSKGQVKN
jgi:hypothetical protein